MYRLNDTTPLLLVVYNFFTAENPFPGVEWIQAQSRRANGTPRIHDVTATVLEQKLLLKVLATNAENLPPDFHPKLESAESGFRASFLLPVGPLNFEDLGRLNADFGCAVCGEKSSKRCSQCQSVSYCGAGAPLLARLRH